MSNEKEARLLELQIQYLEYTKEHSMSSVYAQMGALGVSPDKMIQFGETLGKLSEQEKLFFQNTGGVTNDQG